MKESVWEQMKEIVKFTGPAMGMWVCGPLMSLIDTVVIGQGSSVELAALGTLSYTTYFIIRFLYKFQKPNRTGLNICTFNNWMVPMLFSQSLKKLDGPPNVDQ